MRILLIKAPYLDVFSGEKENNFPLGLGYIAAFLRDSGFQVNLIDPENPLLDENQLIEKLKSISPDIVGISCVTANFHDALKIAQTVKKHTHAKTVLGGVHVSSLPEEVMENYSEIDFCIIGEGEYTMLELSQVLRDPGSAFSRTRIRGLAYKEDGKVNITPWRPWIEDLDVLPFPARDMLDINNYSVPRYIYTGKRSATMISSRGCPYQCSFCAVHLVAGSKFRYHSAKRVVEEMEELVKKYKREFICFWDDTFTILKDRVKQICKLILEKNLKVNWFCLARVDTVDEELLMTMKKAGCRAITYGVESGDPKILDNIKKNITIPQIRKAITLTKHLGFKTLASFMIGNPGETVQTIRKTIQFAIDLNPDIAHFYILSPFPGTEIYKNYKDKLFSVSSDWKDYRYGVFSTGYKLALESKDFGREELLSFLVMANRKFYFRPSYIIKQLRNISSLSDFYYNIREVINLVCKLFSFKNSF